MHDSMMERLKGSAARFWDQTVLGNGSDVGSQPAPVAAANEAASVCGLHSILRYDQYDPLTGLFYNDNSVGFCFEVIAQTGADEDMASRLNTLFTPVPAHYGIQWCLFGGSNLDQQLQAYMDQRHIAVDQGKTTPFFEQLGRRRIEHIYRSRGKPVWPNDNYVVKNIRLVFSITRTGSFRDSKLLEEMSELRETLAASLRTASLPSLALDADGLISFLWPILNELPAVFRLPRVDG